MTPTPLVAFDLDDTLYSERDFLHSGWRAVAREAERYGMDAAEAWHVMCTADNAFDALHARLPRMSVSEMLQVYRTHIPKITLYDEVADTLRRLRADGCATAVITDGRSISQRNKIAALGLEPLVDYVGVSEETGADKTSELPFRRAMEAFPDSSYIYVGDNPAKDFMWPNRMGWLTVMLRESRPGLNIHPQTLPADKERQPAHIIDRIDELATLLRQP